MSVALARIPNVADLTGRQKTAILLMAVGEEASAQITRSMSPEDVEAISLEIAKMGRVDPATVEAVLEEWAQTERAAFSLAQGGVDYARRVLEKAFGPQKAAQVLKRIEAQLNDQVSLAHLRNADMQQLSALIRNEYPQAIALILAFLSPSQTAEILKGIDTKRGSDILLRLARMEKVLPDVLRLLEEQIGNEADLAMSGDGSSAAGGPGAVAEVLNLMSAAVEKELLDGVAETDMELSEQIKDLMFVFEDITKLDDKGVVRLLRDVQTKELSLALKLASDELKTRILETMTSRARDSLLEEMEFLGPVRVRDVERAQSDIVKMARALADAGEIVIGGTDDMVVD
jgi:flagellar motor switch protein FliG